MSTPAGSAAPRGGRVLFVFLDGVGLAPAGPDNPLSTAPMPCLHRLLGGPLVLDAAAQDGLLSLRPVDACLGVPGLPQSATGQTALFTGVNAPALVGDHVTAYPTTPLRQAIAEHSLLKQAAEAGAQVTSANAYSEHYWTMVREGERRLSASTLTIMASGVPFRTLQDLREGRAVLWDITHEVATSHLGFELPLVAPEEAGTRLARLAAQYDLVLYESFLTDLAGHGRVDPAWVLARLDAFLGGILDARSPDTTLVVCSDHGNLEDATRKIHTTNPVPLLALGPDAWRFGHATAITDVAPAILLSLKGDDGSGQAT